MDEQGIVPEAFEKACREKAPKALYLIPTIDNPTTATLPEARRRTLAALARKHDIAIIEDDPYAPLRPERIAAMAELASDATWHIATLSKCVTPALRVAYVVAPSAGKACDWGRCCVRRYRWHHRLCRLLPAAGSATARWVRSRRPSATRMACARNSRPRSGQCRVFGRSKWASPLAPSAGTLACYRLRGSCGSGWRVDCSEHGFCGEPHPIEAVRISIGVAPDRGALEDGLAQLANLILQPSLGAKAVV